MMAINLFHRRGPACGPVFSWLLGLWVFVVPARALEPAAGITEAMYDGTLSLPVAGIVTRCPSREGASVRAGDVLLELDSTLEELEVQRRRLILETRRMDYEALQRLFEQNSISVKKEELDKARADYQVAETELKIAEEQLRRRRLVAPCDGVVVEVRPEVGEAVQAYQPLIRLVDTRQVRFVANVEPAWCTGLRPDQTVTVELDAAPAPVRVRGRVAFISPVADPASGLRRVEVWFENPDGAVAPGVAGRLIPAAPAVSGPVQP